MTVFIATLALMFGAYAVCGVPFGYLISKASAGVDVTHEGSGNIGSTNVARTVGTGAGVATLALDALKGLVCVVLARLVLALLLTGGDTAYFLPDAPLGWCLSCVFMACVLGHIFSPYLGFKGGKGIACGFGAALGLAWPLALIILFVFLVVAVPTRYVSAGSLAASIALPIAAVFWYWPVNWAFEIPLILAALCAIWAHRLNVKRLREGDENKFALKSTKEAMDSMEVHRHDYTTDDVEKATIEAAERDARRRPQAGVTYTFGDERGVNDEVRELEDSVSDMNEEVDEVEREIRGEAPGGEDD